ncbi:hypothetical protein [Parapedobacter sp.]
MVNINISPFNGSTSHQTPSMGVYGQVEVRWHDGDGDWEII